MVVLKHLDSLGSLSHQARCLHTSRPQEVATLLSVHGGGEVLMRYPSRRGRLILPIFVQYSKNSNNRFNLALCHFNANFIQV